MAGGGEHANAGGGYSGGCSQPYFGYGYNGYTSNQESLDFGTGGAYFENGKYNSEANTFTNLSKICYIGGQGGTKSKAHTTSGGHGGIAGSGGKVKKSSDAVIYAFNGNQYTDGVAGHEKPDLDSSSHVINANNQCPIYGQNGIFRDVYVYDYGIADWDTELYTDMKNFGIKNFSAYNASSMKNLPSDSHTNLLVRASYTETPLNYINPITNNHYGIGCGAGYVEINNGSYDVVTGEW